MTAPAHGPNPEPPFIEIVREFDAPRERVFRAWTDPDLVPQWLGPRGLTMKHFELEEVLAR